MIKRVSREFVSGLTTFFFINSVPKPQNLPYFYIKPLSTLNFGSIITLLPAIFIRRRFQPRHRCEIPGCDSPDTTEKIYEPDWLRFTTPYRPDTGRPQKCQRYARVSVNGTGRCEPSEFNKTAWESCRDRWVFEDNKVTIGTEV